MTAHLSPAARSPLRARAHALGRRAARAGDVAFRATLRPLFAGVRNAWDLRIERAYGVRTFGILELEEHREQDRVLYTPTPWTTLRRVLPEHDVGTDDVFIDFGAGMGRALILAAQYPFKRVVGVEVSAELAAAARANLARCGPLRCRDVEIVTSDVLDYGLPDDVTVAFFFNPFCGIVFEAVFWRLVASMDEHPRRIRLIYRNPVEHDFLMSTGRARLVRRRHGLRPTSRWSRSKSTCVYELIAAPAGGATAEAASPDA